tara:strand:+ start:360 stop:902 length:543 start_codon:yes stop_codon:yes gene_type:complete
MSRRRNSLSRKEVIDLSDKIETSLFSWKKFLSCNHILYYLSFENEVRTDSMIERSLNLGKKVYVPRILKSAGKLEICEIENLEKGFVSNSIGIREPCGVNVITVPPDKMDAVVTPGLAFDTSGGRIGFGGGYYDKLFLELSGKSLRIGIAYDFQRVKTLYQNRWDKKVQTVITEKNTLHG